MRVIEEKFNLTLPRDGNRSKGLHVSEVIRSLALVRGILDEKYDVKESNVEDDDTTLMQVGLGWEDYLAKYQHPEIDFHPGELVLDDIAMSPDGTSLDGNGDFTIAGWERLTWLLHEFKFTRKSSRDFKTKLLRRAKPTKMWLWQIMSYRLAMNKLMEEWGLPPSFDAKLHVMFINGNYSWNAEDVEARPKYKIFRMTFTQDELDENWSMIKTHAKEMRKAA